MRPGVLLSRATLFIATTSFALTLQEATARADEPGLLGRLFRIGGSPSARSATSAAPKSGLGGTVPPTPEPLFGTVPATTAPAAGPATALVPSADGPRPGILPQSRSSRAVTEADPLVTRVTLGRTDDGNQFGMFLQVYADGTVIDGEGVHKVGRDGIKGVLDAFEREDLFRPKGHCGGPPTDFIEQVQITVHERNLGRLRSNSFSFSGNNQGCDHAVRHLQTALDALQTKLVRSPNPTAGVASDLANRPAPQPTPVAPPIQLNGPTVP